MQNTENKIKTEDINKDKTSHNQPKKINIKNKKYGNENTIFTELPDNLKILKPIPIKSSNFIGKKRARNKGLFPYNNSFKNYGDNDNNCVFKSYDKSKMKICPLYPGFFNLNENYFNISNINIDESQKYYKPPQIKINVIINNYINTDNTFLKEGKNTNKNKKMIFGISNDKNKYNNNDIPNNQCSINTESSNKSQDNNKENPNKNNISKKFEIIKGEGSNENLNYDEIKKITKNKKRGRKAKKESKRQHNALDQDNIIRKIQVHFLSFIIYFCNDLIQTLLPNNKDLFFKNIQYELKKTVNHAYIEKLKSKKIGDILQLTASPKNKKFAGDINKRSFEKICSINPFLKNFFEMSYLDMFNNYYCQNEREIDIEGYKVKLSQRTRLFIDLIGKNQNSEEKIKEIAEQYFINKKKNMNPIFVIDKK
jgi:hypothetical protein